MTILDDTPKGALRARARDTTARHGDPDQPGKPVKSVSASAMDQAGHWLGQIREWEPYTTQPRSLAQVVSHTRRGGWIPGAHPWWWELPGYVWGYGVAIPVTAVSYALLTLVQFPAWLFAALLVVALFVLAI